MPLTPAEWNDPTPGFVVDLEAADFRTEIHDRYSDGHSTVLDSVLSQAIRSGARTAVIEHRYVDLDYRSEFSAFYSGAYRELPSTCHRMSFFAEPLPDSLLSRDTPTALTGFRFLGYTVLRPIPAAPVGRTMLAPPVEMASDVKCVVREQVTVLGEPFSVEGMPFIAQDAHFGVCAHADAWMVARYHGLRFGLSRTTPAALIAGQSPALSPYPAAPSGVRIDEMRSILRTAGLPTLFYPLSSSMPHGETTEKFLVRYLDSGFPVIVAGQGHVFTAIGYRRRKRRLSASKLDLIVHDDEVGPYIQFGETGVHEYRKWESLVVPVPAKVWTPADLAEAVARQRAAVELAKTTEGQELHADILGRRVTWRTVAIESTEFKHHLRARGASAEITIHYQRIPMPRWIWVAELVEEGGSVVGEIVLDSTNHSRDSQVLAWRIADQFMRWDPESGVDPVPIRVDPHSRLTQLWPQGSKGSTP